MTEYSPTGKLVCPSTGPLDAKIVFVAESPASVEMDYKPIPMPLVGPSGQMLNKALEQAGVDRSQCYVMNCVPVRAPGDTFADHDPTDLEWGRARFRDEISRLSRARVFVGLGANPTEWLLGGRPPVAQRGEQKREGFIGAWRGSVVQVSSGDAREDYINRAGLNPVGTVVPTFHPAAVLRQFTWHSWFLLDIQKAALVAKSGVPERKYRRWFVNDPLALRRLADEQPNMFAIDTEMSPWIVCIVTDEEVHVFEWNEAYRSALTELLESSALKIAHRWIHDWTFIRKCMEIEVKAPIFDLLGGVTALNSAAQRELSPHIATKFTNWPYHKWLTNIDQLTYCGMDTIVTYDAYLPMMRKLTDRKLYVVASFNEDEVKNSVVEHDHKLLMPLLHMQAKGFKIDEVVRQEVEEELRTKLFGLDVELQDLVKPIIQKEIQRFEKPHLFRVQRQCPCCGGGKTQRNGCMLCTLGETVELSRGEANGRGFKTIKQFKESFKPCRTCSATGKVEKELPFNSDSPDQVADVVYRGLHIRPRKFKGNETVKAAQLDPIRDKSPIIEKIIKVSEARAEFDTIFRLRAGQDGLLHCEFDPWGTGSGRVASKESLLEAGTNAQNLPKPARRFVVPRDGYTFLYPDLAQVEARAMCVLSGDKNLRKALYEDIPDLGRPDYHTWLLRAIHDYDRRIDLSRDQSKRVSYAGFYGARPEQLAKELTAEAFRKGKGQMVDAKMAQVVLDTLYRVCPEVPRWQNAVCDEVLRTRRVKSPTGREFEFTGHLLAHKGKRTIMELDYEIKKQVYSRLPQDMAAWVLGLGLMDIFYTPNIWGNILQPLIHVHDALLIEVPIDKVEVAEGLALKYLSRYIWNMDFPAEIKKGRNWYEAS